MAASGVALLGDGWAIGGHWAAIPGAAGVLCLLAVLALPGWSVGSPLVAAAFVGQVALAAQPNRVLVVLGAALLACLLACGEVLGSRLDGDLPGLLRPHALPVLAAVGTGVVVAAVSTLSIGDSALVAMVAVGGAACVALLLLTATRS
jgi:hypothetical protein